ncbi:MULTISPECIES: hypothetical protein [unclassified Moraxella]|uniref:hypothetical protein n=1 Tax=unclassified Moraxella TaxID=2685852 RepID=UPI00359DFE28
MHTPRLVSVVGIPLWNFAHTKKVLGWRSLKTRDFYFKPTPSHTSQHGSRLLFGAGMLAHAGAVRCWWSVRSVLVLSLLMAISRWWGWCLRACFYYQYIHTFSRMNLKTHPKSLLSLLSYSKKAL